MELRTLGRFTLVEPMASTNSVCRLYLAGHEDTDQAPGFVAKLLMPASGPGFPTLEAQFAHEIQLLRELNHPGIPTLVADGAQDGVRYLIMERVDGVDLAQLLGHPATPRSLSREVAVFVAAQLADALRHMHEFEIVADNGDVSAIEILHRDVCPANIFVSLEGDVVLGDLGCALSPWIAPEHAAPQAGHVSYKAPERLTGTGQASVHSDLFGLAVVLWEMLRGERCFAARSELEAMDAIVRFDIAHASRRVSGLSAKLAEIVRRNLDRDPARRYESAYQVLQRLSQSPEAIHAERARSELGALVREARGLAT